MRRCLCACFEAGCRAAGAPSIHQPSLFCSPPPTPADKTVKVWDVATQACQHTLRHHTGKVQAVAWNPVDAPVLLSGGFDKRACLVRPACACLPACRPALGVIVVYSGPLRVDATQGHCGDSKEATPAAAAAPCISPPTHTSGHR